MTARSRGRARRTAAAGSPPRPWSQGRGSPRCFANAVEVAHVEAVEPLADAEDEHAEDEEDRQHQEGARDLDHQWHAGDADGGEDQAVLHRQEADDLADRGAARDHHQQAEQHHRQRECEVLAGERGYTQRGRQHHLDRQRDQQHAEHHRGKHAEGGFDRAPYVERADDPMQQHGNDRALGDQGQHRGDIEVRRVLHPALPGGGGGQDDALRGVGVDQRRNSPLVEQHERRDERGAAQQVRDVGGEHAVAEVLHQANPWLTNRNTTASSASSTAMPRNSGTRNTRILASVDSSEASAADSTTTRNVQPSTPASQPAGPASAGPRPNGANSVPISVIHSSRRRAADSSSSASGGPEYSSTIASCTIASSRCDAGLSTGRRPESASATPSSETTAISNDTRRPNAPSCSWASSASRLVVLASSAKVKIVSTSAGSA